MKKVTNAKDALKAMKKMKKGEILVFDEAGTITKDQFKILKGWESKFTKQDRSEK